MSNLPMLPPGIPSRGEVDSMKRMLQLIESSSVPAQQTHQAHYSGGYAGTAPRQPIRESYSPPPSSAPAYSPYAGREDVDAMKNILEKLNRQG